MTLSGELFNAILSMDAYNRGYDAAIELDTNTDGSSTGFQLGEAIITTESDIDPGTAGVNTGFYALAYSYNGSTIVSIRGTDDGDEDSQDQLDNPNGWGSGFGEVGTPQANMAFAFYQEVVADVENKSAIENTGQNRNFFIYCYMRNQRHQHAPPSSPNTSPASLRGGKADAAIHFGGYGLPRQALRPSSQ